MSLALGLSVILLTTGGGSLQAAEDAPPRAAIEEIVVTARRVQESIQDVPLAVTALSADELDRRGVATVNDLVIRAPSIQVAHATGRSEAAFFGIRGQRADDVLLTSDQAIAVILADVPMNWPYGVGQLGMLDIDSVQVVKGPQGTLFGKNSTGGAIILTPGEPEPDAFGSVEMGVGNHNLRRVEGVYNLPISETLAVRAAVSGTQRDGTVENLDGGDDFRDMDNYAGRFSLEWSPADNLSSLSVAEWVDTETSGNGGRLVAVNPNTVLGLSYLPAFQAIEGDDFFEGHEDVEGFNTLEMWGLLNTTTYDVSSNITIKNIMGYRDFDYEGDEDLDEVPRSATASPLPPPFGPALSNIQFTSFQFSEAYSFTEELQIIGTSDLLDWIAGIYYARTKGKDGSEAIQFNPFGSFGLSGPAGGVTNETIAGFAQGTWKLTDRFRLTTGLRLTQDDRQVTYNSQRIPNPPFQAGTCLLTETVIVNGEPVSGAPAGCEQQRSETFTEPTWNLSADYRIADGQLVYGAYRRGYRSGGFPGRGINEFTQQPFDPEIVDDFEVGYKLDAALAGRPVRINTALFYQDYQDIQRNITQVDPATNQLLNSVANAAQATLYGGELEFTYLASEYFELSGFFSYIDASYDEWDDLTASGEVIDRSPNRFANVPETSGSLTGRFTFPTSSAIGEMSLAGNVYWQDDIALYVDNAVDATGAECEGSTQDSYTIYNASFDWEGLLGMPQLSLRAWGKNLSDKEYYVSALCLYNTVGISVNYQGEPRTYGLDISYEF